MLRPIIYITNKGLDRTNEVQYVTLRAERIISLQLYGTIKNIKDRMNEASCYYIYIDMHRVCLFIVTLVTLDLIITSLELLEYIERI